MKIFSKIRDMLIMPLVLCALLFLPVNLPAANVSLFYDPAYVRMDRAYNVLQSLQRLNHNVSTFTGTDEASWHVATTNADALIVPSLVWTPVLVNDLSPAAKDVLTNYVNVGGRFISHGAYYGRGIDLFYIFSYRIEVGTAYGLVYGNTYINTNATKGTSFDLGPTILPRLTSTFPLDTRSLPANALSIYRTEPVNSNDYDLCDVMGAAYGKGALIYLGWEWLVTPYTSPQGIAAWEEVLGRAITFTHPSQPKANAGQDQVVGEGTLVTLDGSGSSDSENGHLNYRWRQIPSYCWQSWFCRQFPSWWGPQLFAYFNINIDIYRLFGYRCGSNPLKTWRSHDIG